MSQSAHTTESKAPQKAAPDKAEPLSAEIAASGTVATGVHGASSLSEQAARIQRLPAGQQRAALAQISRAQGNAHVQRLVATMHGAKPVRTHVPAAVQKKMTVNDPDDAFEQEADEVADAVMRMTAAPPLPPPEDNDDSDGGSTTPRPQAKGDEPTAVAPDVATRVSGLSGGAPLPAAERAFFESRMGADFSDVRIHTGGEAIQTATDLNARAYTFSNNIAFNNGEYQPGSTSGRKLLAHELTHVVQQGAAGEPPVQRAPSPNKKTGEDENQPPPAAPEPVTQESTSSVAVAESGASAAGAAPALPASGVSTPAAAGASQTTAQNGSIASASKSISTPEPEQNTGTSPAGQQESAANQTTTQNGAAAKSISTPKPDEIAGLPPAGEQETAASQTSVQSGPTGEQNPAAAQNGSGGTQNPAATQTSTQSGSADRQNPASSQAAVQSGPASEQHVAAGAQSPAAAQTTAQSGPAGEQPPAATQPTAQSGPAGEQTATTNQTTTQSGLDAPAGAQEAEQQTTAVDDTAAAGEATAAGGPPPTGVAPPAETPPQSTGPDYGPAPGPGERSPQSPQEDPNYQTSVQQAGVVAAAEADHQPAGTAAGAAQGAAVSPPNEVTSQASAAQVGEMDAQQPQPFDAAEFKAKLMEKIQQQTPQTLEDADDFADNNDLGSVQSELTGEVDQAREEAGENIEETAEEPPDTGGIEARQAVPLEPEPAGAPPQPTDVNAENVAPPPRTVAEVERPLQQGSQSLDAQMAEANVTEEQLANSNEPEFQAALDAKQGAQENAATSPAQYRQEEAGLVEAAGSDAASTAAQHLQEMHGERAGLLEQVAGDQQATQTQDEQERARVAAQIESIYDETRQQVEARLETLDAEVDTLFSEGAAAAKDRFENHHRSRMDAYKSERYSGLDGAAQWLIDKVMGMPGEVNAFYTEARNLYIEHMDAVIDQIAQTVTDGLTEAKEIIAQGRQQVEEYVASLPANLQEYGSEAAQEIQGRFDSLEQQVNDKQNELIDSLAQRYQENLTAIDARIEELQAENRGLIDQAFDMVSGVIGTIIEMKNMLMDVLARAASVVDAIISDPIGFLGNLVDGVKAGLEQFIGNIGTHLMEGFIGWLTGALGEAGITLPDTWDLAGIFQLVMQVLGLSFDRIMGRISEVLGVDIMGIWDKLQEIITIYQDQGLAGLAQYGLAQIIGEDNLQMLMQVIDIVKVAMEGNIERLWELIKEHLEGLKEMIFGQITEFLVERVIKAGITWIISLLNPAGAFIRACKAIYDIVMFFVERGSQIMSLVNAIIGSLSAIVSGNISAMANAVEQALARAIPVAISFLASLLGLGGVSDKVREVIEGVRGMVDRGLDAIFNSRPVQAVAGFIRQIVARISGLVERGVGAVTGALGFGDDSAAETASGAEGEPGAAGAAESPELTAGKQALYDAEASHNDGGGVDEEEARQVAQSVQQRHPVFASITPVEGAATWGYEYTLQRTRSGRVTGRAARVGGKTQAQLDAAVPKQDYAYPTDRLGRAKGPSGHVPLLKRGEERETLPALSQGYHQGDHRGHLIGDRFGGAPDPGNLVPMHPTLNLSDFKRFENQVAAEYERREVDGQPFLIYMKITPKYPGSDRNDDESYRPQSVDARAETRFFKDDGSVGLDRFYTTQTFPNPPGGPPEKMLLINEATAAELAEAISGVGESRARQLEAAVDQHYQDYGELSRVAHLDRLAQYPGISTGIVNKLKEKRARNKLKFYEMEYVDD